MKREQEMARKKKSMKREQEMARKKKSMKREQEMAYPFITGKVF